MRTSKSSLLLLSLLAACGDTESADPATQASPAAAALTLAADPGAAEAVADAKAKGPREQVVVVGRIASIVKGHAVFTLMDTSLPYCGEVDKTDRCTTPWDYCCEKKETRAANSLLVEARGEGGKPLATPALPGLRLLDVVKVRGELVEDEHHNLVLLADGWYRVERPELPADLRWPQ